MCPLPSPLESSPLTSRVRTSCTEQQNVSILILHGDVGQFLICQPLDGSESGY